MVHRVVKMQRAEHLEHHFHYWVAYGNPSRKMGRFLRFIFRVDKSLACPSPAKWCLCA